MGAFRASDRVVCVNDSSQGVFGTAADQLLFPGGSVAKGTVYCVERAYNGEEDTQGLILTSPRIYLREGGREIGFNSTRFRKVHPREEIATTEKAERLEFHGDLLEELLSSADSITDSLDYALQCARHAGGTAGHKHGSRLQEFRRLVELAERIWNYRGR